MSNQTPPQLPANPITDPYKYIADTMGIILNSDGSITRHHDKIPKSPATPDQSSFSPVLSKDISINPSKKAWARIWIPKKALHTPSKLHLLVWFHGGGFVIASPDTTLFQDYCINTVSELPCVMVSISYRLAPEHRLPAAYDDAMEALHWIKTADEAWLRDYADFKNTYIVGHSAGGNLAYHVGLRAALQVDNLLPLKIKGLILDQAFFGGVLRSQSELRLAYDPVLTLVIVDTIWELCLPIGADRDHEYCNPTVDGGSKIMEKIRELKWKILVTGSEGDPLVDRQIELAKLMKDNGLQVETHFSGGFHGDLLTVPSKAKEILSVASNFIYS